MNNNQVLKSVRDALKIENHQLIEIAGLMNATVTEAELESWLKDIGEAGRVDLNNKMMATFLEGVIIFKRGKNEGAPPRPLETAITNNVILKKIRVAFELEESDLLKFAEAAASPTTTKDWSAYFRREGHKNYDECPDSFLELIFAGLAK